MCKQVRVSDPDPVFFLNFSGSRSGRYHTGFETLNNDIKCKMKIYKPSGTGRMRGYNFVRDGDSVQLKA